MPSENLWFERKLEASPQMEGKLDVDEFETVLAEGASGDVTPPASYSAPTISAEFDQGEVQGIANAAAATNAALIDLIAALEARGIITTV